MEKEELIRVQYKLAIDARDKLTDNYHKWMTYYYVANGAILVAITTLFNKAPTDRAILFLSLIGIIICFLWNLSCKGYYYWSKSWINIIYRFEKNIIKGDDELAVYTAFSKDVAKNADSVLIPNKPANISTPKLTLLFSFFGIISWTIFSIYIFISNFPICEMRCKLLITILSLIILLILYFIILPIWTKSRDENTHVLV